MTYKIELTPDDVMLIGAGLDLLPHGKVSALVRKVQEQINAQDAAVMMKSMAAVTPSNMHKRKSRSSKPVNGSTAVSQGA